MGSDRSAARPLPAPARVPPVRCPPRHPLPPRHNVEGCRILVTVPACLELLLLGPTSQPWVRRVRYAILDEARQSPAACRLSPQQHTWPLGGSVHACCNSAGSIVQV